MPIISFLSVIIHDCAVHPNTRVTAIATKKCFSSLHSKSVVNNREVYFNTKANLPHVFYSASSSNSKKTILSPECSMSIFLVPRWRGTACQCHAPYKDHLASCPLAQLTSTLCPVTVQCKQRIPLLIHAEYSSYIFNIKNKTNGLWMTLHFYRVTRYVVNDFDFKFKPVINSNQQ